MIDQGFRIFNTNGLMVNMIPLTSKTEYGGDRVMYHRQDLHSCLLRAATSGGRVGPPANIRTSIRVASCDPTGGRLVLESGEELTADLM